jgi:hypothetical protein
MSWKLATPKVIAVGPWVEYPPTPFRVFRESDTNSDRQAGCTCELCCRLGKSGLTIPART